MPKTLCVLTNWRRPYNVVECCRAWRPQVDRLVIVDNSNMKREEVGFPGLCDDFWRWTRNSGPPCRWAPALMDFDFDYAIFADDDFLPRSDAVERLLQNPLITTGAFSTLGMFGRDLKDGVYRYGSWDYGEVYMTIRMHLVRRDLLHLALKYREAVLAYRNGAKLAAIHDDFMLCRGIWRYTGFPSFAMPGLVASELDDKEGACHRRPGHLDERNEFVALDRLICGGGDALHRSS